MVVVGVVADVGVSVVEVELDSDVRDHEMAGAVGSVVEVVADVVVNDVDVVGAEAVVVLGSVIMAAVLDVVEVEDKVVVVVKGVVNEVVAI